MPVSISFVRYFLHRLGTWKALCVESKTQEVIQNKSRST